MFMNMMGGVKVGVPTATSQAASAGDTAFGPGYGMAGTPNTVNALFPNDPFGIAFWTGVVALAGLLFIRHTLPR